jgi:hypothetical protein
MVQLIGTTTLYKYLQNVVIFYGIISTTADPVYMKLARYDIQVSFHNKKKKCFIQKYARLCGLVVRVLGYRSGSLGSIPGTTRKKSSGSGKGSTQPCEYN